ncbi:hypothetical protein AAG570_005732 [Ranatra chinensis]|uniref:Uncharacterized protein n=1 Tax=Ranatra chinensis TaxID=642074 RepID=A0ABD0XYA6_9HEMI
MVSKRRNMFHKNKKQETTEIGIEIESESDEDCLSMDPAKKEEEPVSPVAKPPPRYKFRKRSSFACCVWLEDRRWDWLRPLLDDYALQARYFLAALFVLAALAVVAGGFVQQSRVATTTAAAAS